MDKKFLKNIAILEEHDVKVCNTEPVWADKPNSVELEYYTNAGGDMIIALTSRRASASVSTLTISTLTKK